MAIDAGGIQIAVALTAACRTPVANLGIRTRPMAAVVSAVWLHIPRRIAVEEAVAAA
jgi:hypothetical protein